MKNHKEKLLDFVKESERDFPFKITFAASNQINSIRDCGYRDNAQTLGDIIDNAIEARGKNIKLTYKENK